MASNLLSILHQESKPIDEEKLKFICSKHNVWDHFKISGEKFVSFSESKQMHMLTKFYSEFEPVYSGHSKKFFYCKDCVFCDCGKSACLKCKVSVVYCDC